MGYEYSRRDFIRWGIFACLLIFTAVLQNSAGSMLTVFGARALPIIPLCVCICMFEREIPGAVLGAFGGAVLDISSGKDGFNTFVLLLICALCGILISHYMRNNIITALCLGAGALAIYQLLYIIIHLWGTGNPLRLIFTFYFPSFALTFILIPLCYGIVKKIYNRIKGR